MGKVAYIILMAAKDNGVGQTPTTGGIGNAFEGRVKPAAKMETGFRRSVQLQFRKQRNQRQ